MLTKYFEFIAVTTNSIKKECSKWSDFYHTGFLFNGYIELLITRKPVNPNGLFKSDL